MGLRGLPRSTVQIYEKKIIPHVKTIFFCPSDTFFLPCQSNFVYLQNQTHQRNLCKRLADNRKDGRAVECGGLENR